MDERIAIPVSLPHPNPTVSYWQDPPDASLANYLSASTLPSTADTVIIGSGLTGASVAHALLTRPDFTGKLLMLEARQACSGATGRNGGHTKAASYHTFPGNAAALGVHEAAKIARLEYDSIIAQQAFVREHGIECDITAGETADIYYDEEEWAQCRAAIAAMRAAMPGEKAAEYKEWSATEAQVKFDVRGQGCVGAVSYAAGSLSAYGFVVGMLRMCVGMGMELYTSTPVVSVERLDGEWRVSTERGVVRARRVVMATNAYTAFLCRQFQNVIVPLRGQITAQRPGRNMPREGLGRTYSFVYKGGFDYMIPKPKGSRFEGDIVIGGGLTKGIGDGIAEYGNTDDSSMCREIGEHLTASTPRYFGSTWGEDDPDGRVRKQWTGIMGYSNDGFPYVGEVSGEKDLWMAASFQGHGMVMCFLSAKALVSMMSGEEDSLKTWFPDAFRIKEERMKRKFTGI